MNHNKTCIEAQRCSQSRSHQQCALTGGPPLISRHFSLGAVKSASPLHNVACQPAIISSDKETKQINASINAVARTLSIIYCIRGEHCQCSSRCARYTQFPFLGVGRRQLYVLFWLLAANSILHCQNQIIEVRFTADVGCSCRKFVFIYRLKLKSNKYRIVGCSVLMSPLICVYRRVTVCSASISLMKSLKTSFMFYQCLALGSILCSAQHWIWTQANVKLSLSWVELSRLN